MKVAGSESRPEPREIILVASCYPIHQIIRIAIFIFGMGCMSASFIRNLTTDCYKMKLSLLLSMNEGGVVGLYIASVSCWR